MWGDYLRAVAILPGGYLWFAIALLLLLCGVIFFHELGHLLAARLCNVNVRSICFGSGPEIFWYTDKRGTAWKIGSLPFGGRVDFGDTFTEISTSGGRFADQRPGKRALILLAGPIASLLLAVGLFTTSAWFNGVAFSPPRIDSVDRGSPAEIAGFLPKDLIVSVDGKKVSEFSELQKIVNSSAGSALRIVVVRDGQQISLQATPMLREVKDPFGNAKSIGVLGISRQTYTGEVNRKTLTVLEASDVGLRQTGDIIKRTYRDVFYDDRGSVIRALASPVDNLFVIQAASLSVLLFLLNILPLPVGDGGNIVWCGVEALRGRPVSPLVYVISFRLTLICGLLVFFIAYVFGKNV